ncbi:30S ribosomal protein S16 [Candidatus Kaiserbacteria bacterium CG10_big_fil_rev_8_21_14_0_10_49_17]|uniref:Small ribosomal subunit protein bS16 n=1 Tax=Candidatus Kaiserbacteria bacterium CG10_big_fil_rev_8_21_14_0_10_49_17 TaxID=1974609 RepID=A0A2M6WEW4_9BACT|nr:MAG: 30S ribosomal protein S16 [Candidatus Kaiserbacteria bacterium CG10_big_fil_rev_8_21_14_0_10_49_17]
MLKIRLQRVGRKNDPSYRVVVVDSKQGPKSGKFVELLGSYSPKEDRVVVDGERAKYWIGQGAQTSDTVHNILVNEKVVDGAKRNPLPKKSPIVQEKEEGQAQGAETETAEAAPASGEATVSETPETASEDAPASEDTAPEAPADPSVQAEDAPVEEESKEA